MLNRHWQADRATLYLSHALIFSCGYRPAMAPENQWWGANVDWEMTFLVNDTRESLKKVMEDVARAFDHQFLNNLKYFQTLPVTAENLARLLLQEVNQQFSGWATPVQSRVRFGDELEARYWGEDEQFQLTRFYRLNCVHQHYNPQLSEQENRELFRKCSHLHGHEYKAEVSVRGELHPETGEVIDRQEMDSLVQRHLLDQFDHRFLNDFFGNTSGEIILKNFHQVLRAAFPPRFGVELRVRETRKNSFLTPGLMPIFS